MTFSSHWAAPASGFQRGSLNSYFTTWGASGSTQFGLIRAAVRAYRRLVSTSSAAIAHFGFFLKIPEPGQSTHFTPPAAVYSGVSSARYIALPSSPASSARWTRS